MLKYKGYTGRIEFDDEAETLHGYVIDTRDVITFEGSSIKEIKQAFKDSIDDYLEFCKEEGKTPDKPYSGTFLVRTKPEFHRLIASEAASHNMTFNQCAEHILAQHFTDSMGGGIR